MCRPPPPKYRGPGNNKVESPTKAQFLQPVYSLELKCPSGSFDIALEPQKTQIHFEDWRAVSDFVESSLNDFFLESHFLPPTLALLQQQESKANSDATETIPRAKTKARLDFPLEISGIQPLGQSSSEDETEDDARSIYDGDSDDSDAKTEGIEEKTSQTSLEVNRSLSEFRLENVGTVPPLPATLVPFGANIEDARMSVPVQKRVDSLPPATPPKAKRFNLGKLTEKGFSFCDNEKFKKPIVEEADLPEGWTKKELRNGKRVFVQVSSGMTVDDPTKIITKAKDRVAGKPKERNTGESKVLPQGSTPFRPSEERKRRKEALKAAKSANKDQAQDARKFTDDDFMDSKWKEGTSKAVSGWENPQFSCQKEVLEFCKPPSRLISFYHMSTILHHL